MPEHFEKMVKAIRKSCEASGKYDKDKCDNIAYGAATNYAKKHHQKYK